MNNECRTYYGEYAIQELKSIWERLQHHPNSDYEHLLLVCNLRGEVIDPFALGLWANGNCNALVAGRVEETVLRPAIGYARLPGPRVKAITIVHEGLLGVMEQRDADAAVEALRTASLGLGADVIGIHFLPEDHLIWNALRRKPGIAMGIKRPHWTIHRTLRLGKEPGFLLRQMRSKHRAWIRRKQRDLADTYPEKVCWIWHSLITDIPALCEKLEAVARTTYQRGLGAGFINNKETRDRFDLFARRGQLRVLLLEIDGLPKAFWLGSVYRGVFHSHATGYTPDVRDFEAGTLVFLHMVDELVQEGISKLDFGLGDASYKERFADNQWREASIQVFAPTLKGCALYTYLGLCRWLEEKARYVVQRLGVFDQVKQSWRRSLRL